MKLQIIKSVNGINEYILLPIKIYVALRHEITETMKKTEDKNEYIAFDPADYVDNPIALARIQAKITQAELAQQMGVSQAYISKIEKQDKVTPKLLNKVKLALKNLS